MFFFNHFDVFQNYDIEVFLKYHPLYQNNIDENESLYDQLKAKNLFICGCESVRMEVQNALGFLDETFYIGLASSSREHCRANDDYLSWNNNTRGLDLTGMILIKKEWEEYYGY